RCRHHPLIPAPDLTTKEFSTTTALQTSTFLHQSATLPQSSGHNSLAPPPRFASPSTVCQLFPVSTTLFAATSYSTNVAAVNIPHVATCYQQNWPMVPLPPRFASPSTVCQLFPVATTLFAATSYSTNVAAVNIPHVATCYQQNWPMVPLPAKPSTSPTWIQT
ncbi:Unknown protein, partial [Striga hermonthica]